MNSIRSEVSLAIRRENHVLPPGSPDWYKVISASKVASIVGLSPWQSAYKLWHVMTGRLPAEEDNATLSQGRYIEPSILAWFQDQKPEHRLGPTGTWRHRQESTWIATPDATWGGDLVEAKSSRTDDWGEPGTAEIPPGYLAQVGWQMVVTGAPRVWVPVLHYGTFKLYVVEWSDVAEDMLDAVVPMVRWFQGLLASDTPPQLDGSDSTYKAVRELHPDLEDEDAVLTQELAAEYALATIAEAQAAERATKARARVIEVAGAARKIKAPNGKQIAYRSGPKGRTPSLTKTKGLMTLAQSLTERTTEL